MERLSLADSVGDFRIYRHALAHIWPFPFAGRLKVRSQTGQIVNERTYQGRSQGWNFLIQRRSEPGPATLCVHGLEGRQMHSGIPPIANSRRRPQEHHTNMVDEPAYQSNDHRPDSNSWIPHTFLQSADGENNTRKVKNWVCEHCHRSFGREEHLERHVTRHLGLRPFMCPICSKPFSRRSSRSQCPQQHLTDRMH